MSDVLLHILPLFGLTNVLPTPLPEIAENGIAVKVILPQVMPAFGGSATADVTVALISVELET